MFALCECVLLQEQPRPGLLLLTGVTRHKAMLTRASCQQQVVPLQITGGHPPQLPNDVHRGWALEGQGLAPTNCSSQTRAAALSTANPRLTKTPTCAHEARWWPKESRRRPHRHMREAGGNGRRRRPNSNTLKSWDSILLRGLDGTAAKLIPAAGPLCDLNNARACSPILCIKSCSRNANAHSVRAAASCCHPVLWPAGSKSSMFLRGGRTPAAKSAQLGVSNPSKLDNCPAAVAADRR